MEGEDHVALSRCRRDGDDVFAIGHLGIAILSEEAGLGGVGKDGLLLEGLAAV